MVGVMLIKGKIVGKTDGRHDRGIDLSHCAANQIIQLLQQTKFTLFEGQRR